jgi:hypothetical protein
MEVQREGIRNLMVACLLRKRIGDPNRVAIVGRSDAEEISDIGWPGRAWFVLQTFVVRLHFVLVNAYFDLAGKGNVQSCEGRQWLFHSAEEQDAECRVRTQPSTLCVAEQQELVDTLAVAGRG